MKVDKFMTKTVVTCNQNQTVEDAAKIMLEKGFSVLPIVNESQDLVGILTESDFVSKEEPIAHALVSIKKLFGQIFYFNDVESLYQKAKKKKVSEVMTKHPITLSPDSSLTEVINMIASSLQRPTSFVLRSAKLMMSRGREVSSFRDSATARRKPRRSPALEPAPSPVESANLNDPPVLFIQKYERLVDIVHVGNSDNQPKISSKPDVPSDLEKDTSLYDETLTQRKIKFVLKMVKKSKSFESLVSNLKEKPEPLFSPPVTPSNSSGMRESIFVDEEVIRNVGNKQNEIHLTTDESADLLKWSDTKLNVRKLPTYYMMLAKSRLTLLVCITSAAGYGLAPVPFEIAPFIISTVGVGLISSAANSVNQFLEVPYDSQMNRTKNRVLVRGYLTPLHAMSFAAVSALSGAFLLGYYVNGVAAALGVANLFLYTCVYTPMKRVSILNTWVGSVVGALQAV